MKYALRLAGIALALSVCVGCSKKATGRSVVLRLSEVNKEGTPTALAVHEFARLVEEKTSGRIKIDVQTGGLLYDDESETIEALRSGELAFGRVSSAPVSTYIPKLNVIQLPYMYRDASHMWKVLKGEVGQSLLNEIEETGTGLVGLCYYDAGARSFYVTEEIHSVADMRGMKIRVMNSPMSVRMCQLLGVHGVTNIVPSEVSAAIQSGTVDGAENNWSTYQSMGDFRAAPYYLLDEHVRIPELLLASKAVMDTLDDEDVRIIKSCAQQTQDFEVKKWQEREVTAERIVRNAGTVVIRPDEKTRREFENLMAPLYNEYGSDYPTIISTIHGM